MNNKQIARFVALDTTNLETVRSYFDFILQVEQSGEEFPVNFDLVWPLAYSTKANAKRALVKDFYEGEDYQIRLNSYPSSEMMMDSSSSRKRNIDGTIAEEEIFLTTKCLEFFIARKVRAVFEVYRRCRIELLRVNDVRPQLQQRVELVSLALEQMLLERGSFRGTVAQLHHRLTDYLSIRERQGLSWPKTPAELGTKLRAITPELLEEGIEVRRLGRQSYGIVVEVLPASKLTIEMHVAGIQWKIGELQSEIDDLRLQSKRMLRQN